MFSAKKNQNSVSRIMQGTLLLLVPCIFFLLLYFFPLLTIFERVITEYAGNLTINWAKIGSVFGFTTWQALLSMILTMLLGLSLAWIFSRYKFPGKKFLKSLFSVPFILPTVVIAAAFSALIGPNGIVNIFLMETYQLSQPPVQLMNTIWIILLAHIFYNISVVLRIVGNAWSNIDRKLEDAAMTLGSSPWKTFKEVTFPLLKPSILSAMLIIFLFDFTSYGVVLLLGGARFRTIEVEIALQALQLFNLPAASLLSFLQIIVTFGVTLIENRLKQETKSNRAPKVSDENIKYASETWEKVSLVFILIFHIIFLLSPMISLVIRSVMVFDFTEISWKFDFYRKLFINERSSFFYVPPIVAIWNSLVNATLAATISLFIGLLISIANNRYIWTRRITAIFMLPIGTSAVTLGLGYLLFFSKNIGNPALIPFAHSLIALPFVIRSLNPLLQGIPNSLRQAGTMLGASPWQVFTRIDLPIIKRGIINAGIFSFTISLGEFGATSFISMPDRPTIPIAIYRFLGQPGTSNYGQAMAMSTILMVICLAGISVLEKDTEQ